MRYLVCIYIYTQFGIPTISTNISISPIWVINITYHLHVIGWSSTVPKSLWNFFATWRPKPSHVAAGGGGKLQSRKSSTMNIISFQKVRFYITPHEAKRFGKKTVFFVKWLEIRILDGSWKRGMVETKVVFCLGVFHIYCVPVSEVSGCFHQAFRALQDFGVASYEGGGSNEWTSMMRVPGLQKHIFPTSKL